MLLSIMSIDILTQVQNLVGSWISILLGMWISVLSHLVMGQVSLEATIGLSCLLCSSSVTAAFSLLSSDLRSQLLELSDFEMRPVSQWAGIYQPNFAVL